MTWGKTATIDQETENPHLAVPQWPAVKEATIAVLVLRRHITVLEQEWAKVAKSLNRDHSTTSATMPLTSPSEIRKANRRKAAIEVELEDLRDRLTTAERVQHEATAEAQGRLRALRNKNLARLYREAKGHLDKAAPLLQEAAEWEATSANLEAPGHLPFMPEFVTVVPGAETVYETRIRILEEQGLI